MNDDGTFDAPLLWYYSPMDSAWSLGHFENRGIVYDAMDELSQFTGAPRTLVANEARLMDFADIVLAGGYELSLRKKERHDNVHFFGCGVEVEHFGKARDPATTIPPDIDFMTRPILGWFGVVDERVDYAMVGVKCGPHALPRLVVRDGRPARSSKSIRICSRISPISIGWAGSGDYLQILPNYCKAFDVNMMCFAINAATQYINPTKALEYLATGRTRSSARQSRTWVRQQYSDLVDIVKTADDFSIAAAGPRRLRVIPTTSRIRRRRSTAPSSAAGTAPSTACKRADRSGDRPKRTAAPTARSRR